MMCELLAMSSGVPATVNLALGVLARHGGGDGPDKDGWGIAYYEGGDVRYGHRLKARLPAKRVPEAVDRWIRFYESERADDEEFNVFVERVGTPEFEARVKDLTMPIEFNLENMNYFIDWTKNSPFVVQRGEGECAV